MVRCLVREMSKRPIGVVFRACSEYDNLVELCHLLEKLNSEGADQNRILFLIVVDQGFVEVKHKCIFFIALQRW